MLAKHIVFHLLFTKEDNLYFVTFCFLSDKILPKSKKWTTPIGKNLAQYVNIFRVQINLLQSESKWLAMSVTILKVNIYAVCRKQLTKFQYVRQKRV